MNEWLQEMAQNLASAIQSNEITLESIKGKLLTHYFKLWEHCMDAVELELTVTLINS